MKNTKIMAVLVVLLAAMLFAGSVTAGDMSEQDLTNVTTNVTSTDGIIAYLNEPLDIEIYNTSALIDTDNVTVTVNWGDGTSDQVDLTDTGTKYNATASYSYPKIGTYSITLESGTASKTVVNVTVYRNLSSQDDAFVYEHIVVDGSDTKGKLIKYSEGTNPTAVNTISSDANGVFYLTEAVVNGEYGAYYYDGTPATDGDYIYIWYPEITLQAELTDSPGDSIDGQGITKETEVTFLINSPQVQPAFGTDATAKIVFTTPSNGKTTYFGKKNINNEQLTGTQTAIYAGIIGDVEAGPWTAQAEYTLEPFATYAEKKSNTISFTVRSESLTVTADKDSVIRSNPFVVAISGEAKKQYYVSITNPETDTDKNPELLDGQSGYKGSDANGYLFETDASGKRNVQFNTDANTEDKTFTIRVTNVNDENDWDEVKIKVEKGAVTITASGDGSYYIGTEITLSGTNTDSDSVYLFITGPNLDSNGEKLLALGTSAVDGGSQVSVKTDNTWEKKWNTAGSGLDTGAYTIYATSSKVGKNDLSSTEYATVSISLKQPFLSAVPSGTIVAKGDDLYIRGTAEGEPNDLKIYIFGPNKFVPESVNVEDDGTYEKKIKIDSNWASNQYFVVIQHPMYNGEFDAILNESASNKYFYINNAKGGEQASFYVEGPDKLQGSNAADALTKMIDNANIDDIYTKLTFTVTEPRIDITNPGDQGVGTKFTISGTTNLAVDDQIIVEVQSSSFEAVDKTSSSITDGVSVTTKVVAGEGTDNVWSVEVDTTNWKLDEYT
ncbi:MAG TPA: hypothetical protein O0X45_05595, partial [Methanocorpusculum sp.]|nr:hypothetical protein [Methanocorpusculum sp.]